MLIGGMVLSACSSEPVDPDRPLLVGVSGLDGERISGPQTIRVAAQSDLSGVDIAVTVDVDGRVIAAEPADKILSRIIAALAGSAAPVDAALAAARQWRFRSQRFEGRAVQAVGTIRIGVLPPEILPDRKVLFPDGAAAQTAITLQRGGCFGDCPGYQVTIHGDGRVQFVADDRWYTFVAWPGRHETRISPKAAEELIDQFRQAHFAGLKAEYRYEVTDNPTYVLTLRRGGRIISVLDYVGDRAGMPESVRALQESVDNVADTRRWITTNAATLSLMRSQGMDMASAEAARIAARATRQTGNQAQVGEFLAGLVAAGAGLDQQVDGAVEGGSPEMMPLGVLMARFAVVSGNEVLFAELARGGYIARLPLAERNRAFGDGSGCSGMIARGLLAAGVDPQSSDRDGNAWHELSDAYGPCHNVQDAQRAAVAQVLLEAQVKTDLRNEVGRLPLEDIEFPEVAEALIRAGADPNVLDHQGYTPLMSTNDDRVALTLLRAGADPHAGKGLAALRARAEELRWPATLAWLDAKGY